MEENNQDNIVHNDEQKKTKKNKNPLLVFLLILVIVIAIIALGLLIRLAIAKDGDYFAPIKSIFNISDEKKELKELKESKSKGKLSKLSAAATKKGVDHYRLTIEISELFDFILESLEDETIKQQVEDTLESLQPLSNLNTGYSVKKLTDYDNQIEPYSSDYDWSREDLTPTTPYTNPYSGYDYDDYIDILKGIKEYINGGRIILDSYVKGNEVIQVVISVEYGDLLENLYDLLSESVEEVQEQFSSFKDFMKYINETLKESLTKEMLVEAIQEGIEESELDVEVDVSEIEDSIDLAILDEGVIEIYFLVNDEINYEIASVLEESADEMEELGLDKDDLFGSSVELLQKQLEGEFSEYNNIFKIEKVK